MHSQAVSTYSRKTIETNARAQRNHTSNNDTNIDFDQIHTL